MKLLASISLLLATATAFADVRPLVLSSGKVSQLPAGTPLAMETLHVLTTSNLAATTASSLSVSGSTVMTGQLQLGGTTVPTQMQAFFESSDPARTTQLQIQDDSLAHVGFAGNNEALPLVLRTIGSFAMGSGGNATGGGVDINVQTSKASGTGTLTNQAILANASGGDVNYFLLSQFGDFRMSTTATATLGITTTTNLTTGGTLADLSASTAIKLNQNITSPKNTIPGDSSNTPQLSLGVTTLNDGTGIQVKNTNSGQAVTGIEVLADTTIAGTQSGGYFLSRGAGGGGGFGGSTASGLVVVGNAGSFATGTTVGDVTLISNNQSLVFAADHAGFTTATRLTPNNHWVQDTSTGLPTLDAACTSGTGSAIVGNDNAFAVTTGTTSTTCTVTFKKTWTSKPICVVTGDAGATFTETPSATTVTFSANQSAKTYNVHCAGQPGST